MATEQDFPHESFENTKWQISTFFQTECGYSPTLGKYALANPHAFELERKLYGSNTFPRYHLIVDFPHPARVNTQIWFDAIYGDPRRTRNNLEYRETEVKRMLAKLEDYSGSDLHRMLLSALNDTLLFTTARELQIIKTVTSHDLKDELTRDKASKVRLRNSAKGRYLKMKEQADLNEISYLD